MRRKSVRAVLKSIGELRGTLEVQRARIGQRLAERLAASPRAAQAYPPVLEHLEAELATLEASLAAAEDAYGLVKRLPAELRRERDRAVAALYQLHAPLERHLASVVEMRSVVVVGQTTKDPLALVQQAGWTVDFLRQLECDPPPPVRGIRLDVGAAAADLEAARERLEAVLAELTAAEADVAVARAKAEAAFAHTESVAPWVAQAVEGLAGLAQVSCVGKAGAQGQVG